MSVMRMEFDTEIAYKLPLDIGYSLGAINLIPSNWEIMDGYLKFPDEYDNRNVAENTKLEINSKEIRICGTYDLEQHPIDYYYPIPSDPHLLISSTVEPLANDILIYRKIPSEIEIDVKQEDREQSLEPKKELLKYYVKNGMAGRIGASRPMGRGAESPTIHINVDDCLYKNPNGYNKIEVFFFEKRRRSVDEIIDGIERLGLEKLSERKTKKSWE